MVFRSTYTFKFSCSLAFYMVKVCSQSMCGSIQGESLLVNNWIRMTQQGSFYPGTLVFRSRSFCVRSSVAEGLNALYWWLLSGSSHICFGPGVYWEKSFWVKKVRGKRLWLIGKLRPCKSVDRFSILQACFDHLCVVESFSMNCQSLCYCCNHVQ